MFLWSSSQNRTRCKDCLESKDGEKEMTEPTNAEEAIKLSKEDIAALHDPEVRKEYMDSWNRAQHHLVLVEENRNLQIELQLMRETDL